MRPYAQSLRGNLVEHTGNLFTAEYLMNVSCPIVLTLDDDSKISVFGTPHLAEKLYGRQIVEATAIDGFRPGVRDPIHTPLSQALLVHRYGKLALNDLNLYRPLDDKTCQKTFSTSATKIAKKLAGALIHSLVQSAGAFGMVRVEVRK
ncbi:hypothetical protein BGX27_010530 [Mortierella sp. AM989]|nr:hypothetical protein BGX27_010530 [Mortierella sp. AM989]